MSLTDDIEHLRQVPLLSALDDEGLRLIAFNVEHVTLSDAQSVFFIGEPAPGALLILDGAISQLQLLNGEMVESGRLEAGTIIDPYALISDTKRTFTAKAVGELTYMSLDRKVFLKVMENYPDLAERVQDHLSDDITQTASTLTKVASRLDRIN